MTTLWEAAAERDAALAVVESHSPHWRAFADVALRTVADRQSTLTSEDVWDELDRMGIPRPVEARAMGVVFKQAQRDGVIRLTGYGKSTNPKHHADVQAFYRSQAWELGR